MSNIDLLSVEGFKGFVQSQVEHKEIAQGHTWTQCAVGDYARAVVAVANVDMNVDELQQWVTTVLKVQAPGIHNILVTRAGAMELAPTYGHLSVIINRLDGGESADQLMGGIPLDEDERAALA